MKFIMILALFLAACTTVSPVVCSVETDVAQALSAQVATSLNCSNPAAIQASLLTALGKANLCTTSVASAKHLKSIIGDVVCPIAVSTVLDTVTGALPASWGCELSSAQNLSQLLTTACESKL